MTPVTGFAVPAPAGRMLPGTLVLLTRRRHVDLARQTSHACRG